MLDVGRSPQRINGLSVFFDHADEKRRYVVPEIPRLLKDPEARISLFLFRGDSENGGLLQLESILAPQEEQLEAVKTELLASTGVSSVLVRPDWRSGIVTVAGWLQEEELSPLSLTIGKPSLLGDPMAIITARLDQAGAALANEALQGNALPTALVYELETLGLSGPLGVTAEADLLAIHDRLTAEGALSTPYGKAEISKTWENYLKDNLIRITVLDESADVEGQRAEALRRIGQDLIARLFSPYPPAEKPPLLNDESVAPLELSFRLTIRREELQTTSHWSFIERRAVKIKHYAAASLIELLGDSEPDNHIRFVDLNSETRNITVRVERELSQLMIAAVEIDINWHGTNETDHTVALTDKQNQQQLNINRPLLESLRYRVRARYNAEQTHAEIRQSDWIESIDSLIVISARELFPSKTLTIITGNVEFDWLDHIEIIIDAANEPSQTLILNSDRRSIDAFFPVIDESGLSLKVNWRGKANEPAHTDPVRNITDDILVLDSPFGSSINILLVPLPLHNVITILVDLKIEHDGFSHAKSVSWDAPDHEARHTGLRRRRGSPRSYFYQVTYIHEDGEVTTEPWLESEAGTLVIGATQPVQVHSTEVVALGGGPTGRQSFAIELVLEAGEHRISKVLEQEQDTTKLVLVADADGPAPVLIAREFLNTGEVIESRWETPDELIVIPLPDNP